MAEALSGVEPSCARVRQGSGSRHPRASRLISSPSPGCCFARREQCLKQSSDLPAFYFPFLFLFAKRALAKRRAFPRQRAVRCGGGGGEGPSAAGCAAAGMESPEPTPFPTSWVLLGASRRELSVGWEMQPDVCPASGAGFGARAQLRPRPPASSQGSVLQKMPR